MYIDDGLNISPSYHHCLADFNFSAWVLNLSGWVLNESKCVAVPTQQIQYLGFCLNSVTMRISLPDLKIKKIEFLVSNILHHYEIHTQVSARQIAVLCGHLAHCAHSHGNFTRIISRFLLLSFSLIFIFVF